MESIQINVEAQIARRTWDEAQQIRNRAADADGAEKARLLRAAEAAEHSARLMVARANSIRADTDPARLEPVRIVPLSKAEIAAREKQAELDAWVRLREDRNALLAASDWTQAGDAPADREAWALYRQQLRDLPAATTEPTEVTWPEPPH